MKDIIKNIIDESVLLKKKFIENNTDLILKCADQMAMCLTSGHKILLFGNGGSAADAQHIAAEFINRFKIERQPLAAMALTTDTSVITSIGNDYSFDDIFIKQIAALGRTGDMALGISTSGSSKNVVLAIDKAKEIGMMTVVLTGRGGILAEKSDIVFRVESDNTARIQEIHITLSHILCELVERTLYPEKF